MDIGIPVITVTVSVLTKLLLSLSVITIPTSDPFGNDPAATMEILIADVLRAAKGPALLS